MSLFDVLESSRKETAEGVGGRVAFVAGKKLGTAPERNRAKRRLREAARSAGAPWRGYDVVFVARQSILETEFNELVLAVERLGVLLEQGRQEEGLSHEEQTKADRSKKKKTILSVMVGIPRQLAIVCIKVYRHVISPLLPPSCRYVPTCSEYAMVALERFGFLKGMWLSVKRLGRCHPLCPGGYDPVPEKEAVC